MFGPSIVIRYFASILFHNHLVDTVFGHSYVNHYFVSVKVGKHLDEDKRELIDLPLN